MYNGGKIKRQNRRQQELEEVNIKIKLRITEKKDVEERKLGQEKDKEKKT